MPLRAAVVGLGRIGSSYPQDGNVRTHAGAYAAARGVALCAGVDPSPEAREAFCLRWGRELPTYATVEVMLQTERPDIVSVCTHPSATPGVVAQCAARAPRLLFLEKPMAVDGDGARIIREAARAVPMAVNYHRCWDPAHERFFARLKGGGPVVGGRVLYAKGLFNYASHAVALLLRHLGAVAGVERVGAVPDPGAQDPSPGFLLRFGGGAEVVFQGMPRAGFDLLEMDFVTPKGLFSLKSGGCRRRGEEPAEGAFYPGYAQLVETPAPEPDGQVQGLAQAVDNIVEFLGGAASALNCDATIGLDVLDVLRQVRRACPASGE